MDEHREHRRSPIDISVEFTAKGSDARARGRVKDISLGGMFVQTDGPPPPFGAEVVVHAALAPKKAPYVLPAVVRWTRGEGMGLQFRPLGARETHAITELARPRGA